MIYDMYDWYCLEPGHYVLCRVTSNLMGLVTATTYDGDAVTGRARRLKSGHWVVRKG